jgi:hypothetical protein
MNNSIAKIDDVRMTRKISRKPSGCNFLFLSFLGGICKPCHDGGQEEEEQAQLVLRQDQKEGGAQGQQAIEGQALMLFGLSVSLVLTHDLCV